LRVIDRLRHAVAGGVTAPGSAAGGVETAGVTIDAPGRDG
jgi:hypothetical protein